MLHPLKVYSPVSFNRCIDSETATVIKIQNISTIIKSPLLLFAGYSTIFPWPPATLTFSVTTV